jgi:hypothetical protein
VKSKLNFYVFLILAVINIFIGCDRKGLDQKTVAEIEHSHKISLGDLNQYIYDNFYDKIYRNNKAEAYKKALDATIISRLKCIDFFTRGLNNDQQLVQGIRRNIGEELTVRYFENEYIGKYTNEEYVRSIYNQMNKEVEYRKIVIYKPNNATIAQLDSLEKLASDIKNRAERKTDFDQLVKQYSQDEASRSRGGYMPPIDWKKGISNQTDNLIFNLKPGEVQILEDNNNFVIIKITNIKKVKLESFSNIKNKLTIILRGRYISQSLAEFEQDKAELLDTQKVVWNEKAFDQFINWSKIPNFFGGIYKDTLQSAISNDRNLTIFTYPDGQVDFKECLRLMNDILIFNSKTKILNKEDLKDYFIEAIRSAKIVQKARDLGLEQEIFNQYTNNPNITSKIVDLYDQAVIRSQIPEQTDSALHEFYRIVKDSLYYKPEKINLYAMIFSDKAEAERVWVKVQQGMPFEKVTNRYFVKTFIKDQDGQIKSYLSTEPPFLGEAAFKLKETEMAGVIEYNDPKKGMQYAVIKCAIRSPEKQPSYEDARKTIGKDFQNYYYTKIHQQVIRELRQKYHVKINENVIAKVIKPIRKK